MKSYEYPRVRPPTSLLPPQQPPDNRFSWMAASAEQEHRVGARRETSTPTPQQASYPQNLAQGQGQGQVQVNTMEPQVYGSGVVPYQIQDPMVLQQMHAPAPHPYGAYPAQPHSTVQVPVHQP